MRGLRVTTFAKRKKMRATTSSTIKTTQNMLNSQEKLERMEMETKVMVQEQYNKIHLEIGAELTVDLEL